MTQRKEPIMKNMELIGYDDLNGKPGFQMALYRTAEGKYYLYSANEHDWDCGSDGSFEPKSDFCFTLSGGTGRLHTWSEL